MFCARKVTNEHSPCEHGPSRLKLISSFVESNEFEHLNVNFVKRCNSGWDRIIGISRTSATNTP